MSRGTGRHEATDSVISRVLLATRLWPFYAPVMQTLERWGERLGADWLIYNPLTFAYYHGKALESASIVADALERAFPEARSYADIGAGTGAFSAELQLRGKTVIAHERSRLGRLLARSQGVPTRGLNLVRLSPADFAPVDVVLCFEVAEHLRPELGEVLVRLCAAKAPIIVFTAAPPSPPGQRGAGHVNEQPKSYWIERFERTGGRFDQALTDMLARGFAGATAYWLADDVMVFLAPRGE
jgi:hypothetical protein